MRTSTVRRLADDIAAWVLKPEAFGDGGGSVEALTMRRLTHDANPDGSLAVGFPYYGVVHTYTLQVTGNVVRIRGGEQPRVQRGRDPYHGGRSA